ncbi:hypothetical protein LCGC14_1196490 [marine sediment metagenome]|uniref:Uncharacterized protein n=1 Tax=marine sediment metagenome TaxID=412755 RepID=A0A0F9M5G9_9ZZZZ
MNTVTPSHGKLQKYRVYFEPVEVKRSLELLQARFESASIFQGDGLWAGQFEKVTVFEIHTVLEAGYIEAFAEEIRALNGQASVRVTMESLTVIDINSNAQAHANAPDVSYPLEHKVANPFFDV